MCSKNFPSTEIAGKEKARRPGGLSVVIEALDAALFPERYIYIGVPKIGRKQFFHYFLNQLSRFGKSSGTCYVKIQADAISLFYDKLTGGGARVN